MKRAIENNKEPSVDYFIGSFKEGLVDELYNIDKSLYTKHDLDSDDIRAKRRASLFNYVRKMVDKKSGPGEDEYVIFWV